MNDNEYLPLGDEAQSSSIVCCIADGEYQVGEILWNEKEKKITFRDISLHCSNQPGNLLSAFIRAEGFSCRTPKFLKFVTGILTI